jgi:hypothetical protein
MSSLFTKLNNLAGKAGIQKNTKKAQTWFKQQISDLGKVRPRKVLKDDALDKVATPVAGQMYHYVYDPKHKDTLPHYDRFPLTIFIEPAKGGFYGLNLHYLSPGVRARFLDSLMETAPKNITDTSKLQLSYEVLKGVQKYKEFKPCFKHYLTSHIKSNIVRVPMTEWEIAIFLPTEQFKGAKASSVWRSSSRNYNR